MRIWLNGRLVPSEEATVSVFDRGFLFGDGVYELIRYFNGVGLDLDAHITRLGRSLAQTRITGFDPRDVPTIGAALLEDASLRDAGLYLQVTRGTGATRAHVPPRGLQPTVCAMISELPPLDALTTPGTLRAVLREDRRWLRCSIKTTSLQGNILALLEADDAGAHETILHRNGLVSEGTHTNVFAVVGGVVVTPPLDIDPPILHGVTRTMVLDEARRLGLPAEERPLHVSELTGAEEIFLTSTRRIIASIVALDDRPVSDGQTGPTTTALFDACRNAVARRCGLPAPARPFDSAPSAAAMESRT